jgi:hypothetical protein
MTMRRFLLAAMVVASMVISVGFAVSGATAGGSGAPFGGRGESASTPSGLVPARCLSTTWDVTLDSFPQSRYHMNPLIKCGKTLSGSFQLEHGCSGSIAGTLDRSTLNMTWSGQSPCDGEVVTFQGTLKIKKGTGHGNWMDNKSGNTGTFTATRTS